MLKAFIVSAWHGHSSEEDLVKLAGGVVVKTIEEANCLVFCGGADIDPKHYNQANVYCRQSKMHDDVDDKAIAYWESNKDQFVMLWGLCRGAQRLNCLSGGSMWQDVDCHYGNHSLIDMELNEFRSTNSVHHQMMRPGPEANIIAYAWPTLSTRKLDDKEDYTVTFNYEKGKASDAATLASRLGDKDLDVEVIYYPNTKSLCFQGHPEYFQEDTTSYFIELVNRYYKV